MRWRRRWALLAALSALEVTASGAALQCPEHLQFLKSKCAQWQSDVLPKAIPPARGNAFADDEPAAALGMKVFYDNRFSQSGSGVACVNCHDPEHAFAERKATSHTIREVARNAPDLINAAWYTQSHFWDGKVDNLWSAPLFTLEQDDEMGSTRLSVVHTLASIYRMRYEKIFGPMPDFSDLKRFPASGKPGTPEFDSMSAEDKAQVDQVYVKLGKALEAYIRKLAAGRAPFDDFINGSTGLLSADAQRGMVAFTKYACDTCHSGPTFTDEAFHNLGYPTKPREPKDLARAGGVKFVSHWQFSSSSKFADTQPAGVTTASLTTSSGELAGFRTPTLRNVTSTSPYGHDGQFETLEEVIDAHRQALPGHAPLAAQDKHDIVEFLRSLTGRPPQRPWNYWPGG
ncbi:MAG TPA: cytochrome c peroxidase [Steroidobacteraceae bacterium]|nr:cytochrome c peroxidase [Steroidobacteraceae bacterium]